MFRAIEATAVVFTKKAKVKTRKTPVIRRPDTPRPTDEEALAILTADLTVMPTVVEQPQTKKIRNTNT